jgi:folate-binding protein YgfZ
MTGPAAAPDPAVAADYEALRHGCGAHRLARDVLEVAGPDAVEYLQGQCSQDVAALGVGEQADALLLAPDGKLEVLVRLLRVASDGFLLDTEGGFGEAAAARLLRFKLRSKVEIQSLPWSCVALRGPTVTAVIGAGADPSRVAERDGVRILPVAWNGTSGVDLLGPEPTEIVPEGVHWCGTDAWEALRVEAGIPALGRELDEHTIAAEAGLVERTVSFTKGCYTGQELVARLDARGNRVARRLCGIVPDRSAAVDPRQLLGAALMAGADKAVGQCTSAAWCPGVSGPAALAYVHRSVAIPGTVTVALPSADGSVVRVPAEVRPLPLA